MSGPGKSLAIASLSVGVVSLPTGGCLGLGAFLAIGLGVASLLRSRQEPAADNGRELAVAGIVAAVLSLAAAVPLALFVYGWRQTPDMFADVRMLSEWPEPKAGVFKPATPGWALPPPPPPPPPTEPSAPAEASAPPPPPPPPPTRRARTETAPARAATPRPEAEPPTPATAPASPEGRGTEAVRVGGQIREPRKLKNVSPVYPEIAKNARVQGIVILECRIGTDGRVEKVTVLRGIPLLDEAAVAAVREWVYTPTVLNGVPVPVIMTVTVNFRLS
jgi:protein TonB